MILDPLRRWSKRRQIMRELAAYSRTERDRDAMRFAEILERAEAAMAADQHVNALRIFRELQERFYRQASESPKLFKIALDLHQYDDAQRLIKDGLARYPREMFFIVGYARVAEEMGDTATALERWAVVRQKFPWLALAYARTAACLAKAGRMEEADAMLTKGIKRSPDDVFCLIEHARIAESRGNFEVALVRWQHLREIQPELLHPSYQNGTVGLAQCLRRIGRLEQAEAIIWPFLDRFGVHEVMLMELAMIAEVREDWTEALSRWQRVKGRFPMLPEGYRGVIRILRHGGHEKEADKILAELADRFADELGFALDYANNARKIGDDVESARRWGLVLERFPDCAAAYQNGAAALVALGQVDAAAALRAKHQAHLQNECNAA